MLNATRIRTSRPPATPPAIAATGVDFELGVPAAAPSGRRLGEMEPAGVSWEVSELGDAPDETYPAEEKEKDARDGNIEDDNDDCGEEVINDSEIDDKED